VEQVKNLQKDMEETMNVCIGCHGVENVCISACCKVFMCPQCIQKQRDINNECPVCKIPMSQVRWTDLTTALQLHQAISNVISNKKDMDKKGKDS